MCGFVRGVVANLSGFARGEPFRLLVRICPLALNPQECRVHRTELHIVRVVASGGETGSDNVNPAAAESPAPAE